MRRLFVLLLALPLACFGASDPTGGDEGVPNGSGGDPLAARRCTSDDDCVPVAATCCECPTFAVNRNDPYYGGCVGVTCPMPGSGCSEDVAARCNESGACELACPAVECEASCAAGFATDALGCLTCECAVPELSCTTDAQCARTREDCCGCAQGGEDTAVLVASRDAYDAMLRCPPQPACPGIDICTADEPQCTQGRCALLPALPPAACGRSDLMRCPPDQVCTVNLNDVADLHGLGVCAPR